MKTSVEERVTDLEKQVADLKAKVLKLTPVKKDWRRTVGMLTDDELSREADRRGAEWRRQSDDTDS
jgi:hypothetical protein